VTGEDGTFAGAASMYSSPVTAPPGGGGGNLRMAGLVSGDGPTWSTRVAFSEYQD